MKIPQYKFGNEFEVYTYLNKVKLVFKVQHMFEKEDILNVVLQNLDEISHTWGEIWMAKKPRGILVIL